MNPAEGFRAALSLLPALGAPFVAVARHLGSGMRPSERLLIGAALAPIALTLPALLFVLGVHGPLATGFWTSEFLWLVAALWPAGRTRNQPRHEPRPERGQGFPSIAVTLVGVAVLLVTVAPPFLDRLLALSGEPWFQSAAALEIRQHGLPPQDPTFAGMPFYHAWMPPFLLALVHAATGASPFALQVLLAAWAAWVWTLAIAQVAYRAFGRGAASAAAALAALGFNSLGWLFWLLHSGGEGRGAFAKLASLAGVENAAQLLGPALPAGDASLLLRFWGGAEQSFGLALAATLGWIVVRGLERRGGGSWGRTLCVALALLFWSPECARPLLAALLGGWALATFGGGGRSMGFVGVASLLGAWLITWPYRLPATLPGGAGAPALGLTDAHFVSLAIGVGPLWLAVLPAALIGFQQNPAGRFAVGAFIAAAATALLSYARPGATDMAMPMTWLWIAPLAGGGLVWWSERSRLKRAVRRWATGAVVVPTTVLLVFGALADRRAPGTLVRSAEGATRTPVLVTEDEARVYRVLSQVVPKDAAVIESAREVTNEAVPVLGARRLFFPPHGIDSRYRYGSGAPNHRTLNALREEFQVRRGIQLALFDSEGLSPAQEQYLYAFATPVYVLVRRTEVSEPAWHAFEKRPEWGEILSGPDVRLYRFEGEKRGE